MNLAQTVAFVAVNMIAVAAIVLLGCYITLTDNLRDQLNRAEAEVAREHREKLHYKMERDTVLQRDKACRSYECFIRDEQIDRLKEEHEAEMKALERKHQEEMHTLWREYKKEQSLREAAQNAVENLMRRREVA